MTTAAENDRPLLTYCRLGKDRTGLMTALVLSTCGATQSEIVTDYSRWEPRSLLVRGSCLKAPVAYPSLIRSLVISRGYFARTPVPAHHMAHGSCCARTHAHDDLSSSH